MPAGTTLIFAGPEIGEKQDEIAKVRKTISEKNGSQLEETSFYAFDVQVSKIVSVLLNASLFSQARLIIVKNAEYIKKKEDIETLVNYIQAPCEDTTLILTSDLSGIDKKIEDAVLKMPNGKNNKRIFWELFEDRKEQWVRTFFKNAGVIIDQEGIAAVLEMVENNTDALRRECSGLL
ncbi:MAG: DNA polymerase III subunit delta, partial [Spirochaetaceae bacterium]|nr:DNA polymerase III subunit delta [Spirochaetaceae bacterium]